MKNRLRTRCRGAAARRRQGGVFMIAFALLLLVILAFMGMALDMARIYNRKVELQNVADDAALAAAYALDGTPTGISNAANLAQQSATAHSYAYAATVAWNPAALTFSDNPDAADGAWQDATAATLAPDGLLYARVDTSKLDVAHGAVGMSFTRLLDQAIDTVNVAARAVAGRGGIKVTPLAVCALSATAAAQRLNGPAPVVSELVEYGFRRGVGYNLLNLNPIGASGVYYLVDPIAPPGTAGSVAHVTSAVLAPWACSGTLPLPRIVTGKADVNVAPGPVQFPLAEQLNSRLDVYPGGANACSFNGAPPDSNVKAYTPAAVNWMSNAPAGQSAVAVNPTASSLATVAELDSTAAAAYAPGSYGPLWSYATAVQYAATPPSGGYTALARTTWAKLYASSGTVAVNGNFPTSTGATPYTNPGTLQSQTPAAGHLPLRLRRVMNIPLLACPVASGGMVQARVLAIGRFFLTAQATTGMVAGEFAGVVAEQSLGNRVGLYQ